MNTVKTILIILVLLGTIGMVSVAREQQAFWLREQLMSPAAHPIAQLIFDKADSVQPLRQGMNIHLGNILRLHLDLLSAPFSLRIEDLKPNTVQLLAARYIPGNSK